MRVLLDENVDRRLRTFFEETHEVVTVVEQGWGGVTNGELLSRAEKAFDVLVTMDQNLRCQQNLEGRFLGVVVVKAKSNRPSDIRPAMGQVNEALSDIAPGEVGEVAA